MWPVGAGALILAVAGLIIIFRNSEIEGHVFIKLAGYSLLGGFIIWVNGFPVPLGLLVFLGLVKPSVNKTAKTRAAFLGLILMILLPLAYNLYFERPVNVAASSTNIYSLDLSGDWQKVREKIGNRQHYKLEDFEVSYEADGEIRNLRYSVKVHQNEINVYYWVEFTPNKQVYTIRAKKIDPNIQFGHYLSADSFFQTLEKIDLRQGIDEEELAYYVASCSGNQISSATKETHFLMEDDQITLIDNSDLPITGFYIAHYPMKQMSKSISRTTYSNGSVTNYWFRY